MNKNKNFIFLIALFLSSITCSSIVFAMNTATSFIHGESPLPLKIVNTKIGGSANAYNWQLRRPFWSLILQPGLLANPRVIRLTPKCEHFFSVIQTLLLNNFAGAIREICVSQDVLALFELRYKRLMDIGHFLSCCASEDFFKKISAARPVCFEDHYKEMLRVQGEGAAFYPSITLHLSDPDQGRALEFLELIKATLIDENFESMLESEASLI